MSFGTGGFFCKSSKQKLNTKSSTEAEVVGASDYFPNTMWVTRFLEEQGHSIIHNFFEQDNESAIKMEKNGRASAGQKSRHINIRYFFIKDQSEDLGVTIRHCPTLQMLGDFFTKPLQGNLFRKFRDVILGYKHVDTLTDVPPVADEERVGIDEERTTNEGPTAPGDIMMTTEEVEGRISEPEGRRAKAEGREKEKERVVTWAQVVANGAMNGSVRSK